MIRGILGVVRYEALVAGAFYLYPRYDESPLLMQAVTNPQPERGGNIMGLIFDPSSTESLLLTEIDQQSVYTLMPEVSLRIDPPSIAGTAFTRGIRPPMLLVFGATPYVVAWAYNRGYFIVNLSTGQIEELSREPSWACFSRWQLVVDENGEEVAITSFGDAPA